MTNPLYWVAIGMVCAAVLIFGEEPTRAAFITPMFICIGVAAILAKLEDMK